METRRKKPSGALVTDFLISLPALLLYIVFFTVPVLIGVFYSTTDWNGITRGYHFIGLKNYGKLLHDARFGSVIWFTLRYALLLVVGVILCSLVVALVLYAKPRGWQFFKTMFFLPCLFSLVTTGLLFKQVFSQAVPLLGKLLGSEVLSQNLLASSTYAQYAILLVNIWAGVSIPTVLMYAALCNVPRDLYEVAEIDGASRFKRFTTITIPYILPTISMIFVTTLKSGLGVFEYIMTLTAGGPGNATASMAYVIYTYGLGDEHKYAYASAMSIVMWILMTVISLIYIRATKNKEVSAA